MIGIVDGLGSRGGSLLLQPCRAAMGVPARKSGACVGAAWRQPAFVDDGRRPASPCVFMTGVTLNVTKYLPGAMCIMKRLRDVGSRYPLVFAVPPDEAEVARAALAAVPEISANSTVMSWSRFPYEPQLTGWARRWRGTRVFDKLNMLGAPFERVVWLDTDVLINRNVDELCQLDAPFAAAYNSGHEARTCWSSRHMHLGDECRGCRHHGVQADEQKGGYWVRKGLQEQRAGNRSGLPRCTYEFNSGVVAFRPLNRSAFVERVVRPVSCGRAPSRDGGDQGTLNSLAFGLAAFDDMRRVYVLPSTYNALHRVQMLRPPVWRRWDPALVHIVGHRKPWSEAARKSAVIKPDNGNPYFEQERAWLRACEPSLFTETPAPRSPRHDTSRPEPGSAKALPPRRRARLNTTRDTFRRSLSGGPRRANAPSAEPRGARDKASPPKPAGDPRSARPRRGIRVLGTSAPRVLE